MNWIFHFIIDMTMGAAIQPVLRLAPSPMQSIQVPNPCRPNNKYFGLIGIGRLYMAFLRRFLVHSRSYNMGGLIIIPKILKTYSSASRLLFQILCFRGDIVHWNMEVWVLVYKWKKNGQQDNRTTVKHFRMFLDRWI